VIAPSHEAQYPGIGDLNLRIGHIHVEVAGADPIPHARSDGLEDRDRPEQPAATSMNGA
jgi:hypothetical protein